MVLLNGVKYACERCIRGHRVSSCTHTDKPLTMIKPKGRPASQCLHCRELRKLKNTHSSCSCGKKGKSPGQHLASCLCHKNSHCTCPSKEKKEVKGRQRTTDGNQIPGRFIKEEPAEPLLTTKEDQELLIEDVLIPFDTDQGLLDYFQDGEKLTSRANQSNDLHDKTSLDTKGKNTYTLDQLPHPPSDADLDLMENMFPLFPLVGANSFDDSRSLPLLPMPNLNNGTTQYGSDSYEERTNGQRHAIYSDSAQQSSSDGPTFPPKFDNIPLNGGNGTASGSTHNPRPLKASISFNSGSQHPAPRPKRPESVLSIASTSSNTSKQNLLELANHISQGLPKLSSSAAFPPYHHFDVGSNDDLLKNFFENSHVFNESSLLPLASDNEDLAVNARSFSVSATPQSSLPSRQPLQLRRKPSVSRSHSQLHQHHGSAGKDNTLTPLKSATSIDTTNSPFESVTFNNFNPGKDIDYSDFISNQEWLGQNDLSNQFIAQKTQQLQNDSF